jgi:hypothetical protein
MTPTSLNVITKFSTLNDGRALPRRSSRMVLNKLDHKTNKETKPAYDRDFEISDDDEMDRIKSGMNFGNRRDISGLFAVNYRNSSQKSRKAIANNAKALANDVDFQLYQTYEPSWNSPEDREAQNPFANHPSLKSPGNVD